METFDLLIVGGGIAGLAAALASPRDARILVIDKGEAGAGSSPLAQGGMAAAVGPDDSVELHASDTIRAGAGICDEAVVRDVCAEGPDVVDWLTALGCDFDKEDGNLDLAREAGQSVARSVHWRDATGAEIVRALRNSVRQRSVVRREGRVQALLIHLGRCVGVHADGEKVRAGATLLATGGTGALWGRTTNALGATGDGIALAAIAGAQLADLEFMQFHPTALDAGGGQRVLLTEALRGAGAIVVDERGDRFVDELAPRSVVTKAIMERGGRAYLDCRPIRDLEGRFPTILEGARARGFDPAAEPVPIAPAAHYFIGGVAADTSGRTSIPGLFAAGECAATGMHGANRMAGNSLLESVVVGRRVGQAGANQIFMDEPEIVIQNPLGDPADEIALAMWRGCGPVRDEAGLQVLLDDLARLPPTPHHLLCRMIASAALARAETRGVHIRAEFAEADRAFASRSFDQLPAAVRSHAANG